MKRRFCVFLSFIFTFLFLCSSCSSAEPSDQLENEIPPETISVTDTDDVSTKETIEKDSNEYQEKVAALADFDFKGASFRIATDSSELIIPSGNSGFVSKEKYLRNRAVEKKYNVKLTLTEESGLPTIGERVKSEMLAGTDFCDLIVLEAQLIQNLAINDLLTNIREIPYLDFNSDDVHPYSLEATTFGSQTYAIAGDLVYDTDQLYGIFFNKTLLSSTELPNVYELVTQNQWDFENFLLYAEEVFAVSRTKGNNIKGITSTENKEKLLEIFWAASGNRFIDNQYGYRPMLDYNNESTTEFISFMQKMLFRSVAYKESSGSAVLDFSSGFSFFMIAPLSTAKELAGCGVNWGILPLPKQDINQERYASYMSSKALMIAFPKNASDLNFSGVVSNALIKASAGISEKLTVTNYLNLYLNSLEDAEMIRYIVRSPYYDPIAFFSELDPSIIASTHTLIYRVVSSDGRFKTLYNQYEKMFEKFLNKSF